VEGYEIHLGRTGGGRPWLEITRRNGEATALADGAASDDGRVWGCYLHGLFANPAIRRAWLAGLSTQPASRGFADSAPATQPSLHQALDQLADAVEAALDMRRLEAILREGDQG
jgi:adenosylcobyric acid synthase